MAGEHGSDVDFRALLVAAAATLFFPRFDEFFVRKVAKFSFLERFLAFSMGG